MKNNNHKHKTFLAIGFALLAAHCTPKKEILIAGSETMKDVIGILAESFNKSQKQYEVKVGGGGSKAGIEDLTHARIDIAMTSNDVAETHLAALSDISKYEKIEIGYDGLAILVHPTNPVNEIHLAQYAQILAGKAKNWKEIGGSNLPIIPVLRDRNSGTEAFVREHVLRRKDLGEPVYAAYKDTQYAGSAVTKRDNAAILEYVANNPGAIAYMGLGVVKAETKVKVKILKYSVAKAGPFTLPSVTSIQKGEYRLSRALSLVYAPDNAGRDRFLSYALSVEGQKQVLAYEYMQATDQTVLVIEKRLPGK